MIDFLILSVLLFNMFNVSPILCFFVNLCVFWVMLFFSHFYLEKSRKIAIRANLAGKKLDSAIRRKILYQ
jgi:hypothetical protein